MTRTCATGQSQRGFAYDCHCRLGEESSLLNPMKTARDYEIPRTKQWPRDHICSLGLLLWSLGDSLRTKDLRPSEVRLNIYVYGWSVVFLSARLVYVYRWRFLVLYTGFISCLLAVLVLCLVPLKLPVWYYTGLETSYEEVLSSWLHILYRFLCCNSKTFILTGFFSVIDNTLEWKQASENDSKQAVYSCVVLHCCSQFGVRFK